MNTLALSLISSFLIGIGATLTFDLWGLFLKHAFKVPPSNICLVGRWLRYMPDGVFVHTNIAAAPRKRVECQVGWMAHYLIGISFAGIFVAIMGTQWLKHPTPLPAVVFGVVTALAPFFDHAAGFRVWIRCIQVRKPGAVKNAYVDEPYRFWGRFVLFWMVGQRIVISITAALPIPNPPQSIGHNAIAVGFPCG